MGRFWLVIGAATMLAACGSDPVENAEAESTDPVQQSYARVARRGINEIAYPACSASWSGDSITPCGRKVFVKTMDECRTRARFWQNVGELLDEYSGDSWQRAAGQYATANDDARIKALSPNVARDGDVQTVAFAVGQGTDDIQKFTCNISKDLKLTGIDKGSMVSKNAVS
jgi:hypothetical protein